MAPRTNTLVSEGEMMIKRLYMNPSRMERIRSFLEKLRDGKDSRMILEFGVGSGYSLSEMGAFLQENRMKNQLIGLDTFEGLPESDGVWIKGQFCHSLEEVSEGLKEKFGDYADEIKLVRGNFSDSLTEEFRKNLDGGLALAHIDSDLYSSCKTVLEFLQPHLKNTYLIFDEWDGGEGQAWEEFAQKNPNMAYRVFGVVENQQVILVRSR